jgi:glutamate N-acetyltransferase / amino-acid N-acetyltransferase
MGTGKVSPLAPATIAELPPIAGVRLATASAGIRYEGRTDVMLAVLDKGTAVAGVLTRSRCPSAPVEWCRARLSQGKARALVVNSGNANAFTGAKGIAAVKRTAALAAEASGCKAGEVFIASTGVIGEPLDAEVIGRVLRSAALAARPENWRAAARSIMTTDTFPKLATATAKIGKTEVRINGIAKGSGMIAPDMATMLSFVFTDAPIAAPVLQSLVKQEVVDTFNAVTVDGDTSTSDTLLVFATGAAAERGAPAIKSAGDKKLADFRRALHAVLADLAEQIARDGEGARKLVRIHVKGAVSKTSARKVA